ncbi:hypothetical protein K491DRAFT_70942 [Lophiostoma macrostomum CBS 122681]|uniref:Uncharacterized protein n=1 Tax=Lophiostoma macrostomum CBS 122681 TaxID=1314788 RepID=A0A6A6SYF3_9PLEO|nr:hypothetical protein K491DRAFT_70942 [Lophiostoma macrostomum CBS 122681]
MERRLTVGGVTFCGQLWPMQSFYLLAATASVCSSESGRRRGARGCGGQWQLWWKAHSGRQAVGPEAAGGTEWQADCACCRGKIGLSRLLCTASSHQGTGNAVSCRV